MMQSAQVDSLVEQYAGLFNRRVGLAAGLFGAAAKARRRPPRPDRSPLVELYADWERRARGALMAHWGLQARRLTQRLRADVKAADDVLGDGEWWEAWVTDYVRVLLGFEEEAAQIGAAAGIEQLAVSYALGVDAEAVNVEVADWARRYAGELAGGLAETDRAALRRHLAAWAESHEDLPALVGRVDSFLNNAPRARRIAVTEATRAYAEGNLAAWRVSEVVTGKVWNTARDELVCFPAGTQVMTETGDKAIEAIKAGEMVKTQFGWNRVLVTNEREYLGELTIFTVGGRIIICTANHPIWEVKQGWLDACNLNIGYLVQLSDDEVGEIDGVVNFTFPDSDDGPAVLVKIMSFSRIAFRVLMPICAIYLKSNIKRWKQKINAITSHLGFLNKRHIEGREGLPDRSFQHSFTLEVPVTGERTELPGIYGGGFNSKAATTIPAFYIMRGASAFLRAEFGLPAILTARERFAAVLTSVFFNIDSATFPAANGIAVGDGSIHGKRFAANRADFLDYFRSTPGGVTFPTTEALIASVLGDIKAPTTPFASFYLPCFTSSVVTFSRAISMFALDALRTLERFPAALANVVKRHSAQPLTLFRLLYHGLCGKTRVYNLQIENDPTFYANGVLVHNCPICGGLDGQVTEVDGDVWRHFARPGLSVGLSVASPPAHPN